MLDPELKAMAACHEQLNDLDFESKVRVIQWLISKYELNSYAQFGQSHVKQGQPSANVVRVLSDTTSYTDNAEETLVAVPQAQELTIDSFETVAELFAATSPVNDWQKALVVAAYLQVKSGLSSFTAFEVNKELKNLGHGSSHISYNLQICIDKKPQLILQLRKEGKTKQAQKKYKVSGEGIKFVKSMIKEY